MDEPTRAARLLEAQAHAEELFSAAASLIVPGKREQELSDEIRDLAAETFGVSKHWHKRIVRAGPNTLHPYRAKLPDRVISDDDIVFVDLGPVFAEWEADFGRTFVLGDDPHKLRLRDALPVAWAAGRHYFERNQDISGAELYAYVESLARVDGYEFGGEIAGHLVGEFPHERIEGEKVRSYIAPGNDTPMRGLDPNGRARHWILEIHLVDRAREIGGFYEQLLTV